MLLQVRRIIVFLCIQISCLAAVVAQTDIALQDIHEKFEYYNNQSFVEKVFVHTDREFYVAGENMWFKLYVLDGSTHKAVDVSKVAYLEVLDEQQQAVLQTKINLNDGIGSGSFYLPLSLKSGTYMVRAYTQWMKNFPADYYFQKPVSIVNTFLQPAKPGSMLLTASYDVQFFPEGGDLVAGIKSKIAFRAVGKDGKGIDFEGVVLNQKDDTVALLKPLKFGIGHFYLQPESDIPYRAIIKTGKDSLIFSLPAVQERGYVMQLRQEDPGKIEVTVMSHISESLNLYLLGQTRNNVKVAEAKKMENGKAVFTIDKAQLGEGISQFTIFNHEQKPVAERLFFKYPEQKVELAARTEKEVYLAREEVAVELSAMVEGGPAESNLSMAVYKLDSLSAEANSNIMSYLWLSSDLKGMVEDPGYYFRRSDPMVVEGMDNLMLTHGWRRFNWEDVLQKKEAQLNFIPEYEGYTIKGKVADKRTGAPVKGVKTFLSVPGKLLQFYVSESNEKGDFLFVTDGFYGSREIVLQTQPADSSYELTLQDPYATQNPLMQTTGFEYATHFQEPLRSRHIQMQAQNIYWEEERNNYITPSLDSIAFWGPADKKYLLDDYSRFPTMEEVMREYVYDVRVRKEKGKFKFMVFSPHTETFYPEGPLILLDGVPVVDTDEIIGYNPLKVESLEVYNGEYSLGGDIVYPGIVSYTTYTGALENFQLDPGAIKTTYDGLQVQRQFFQPVYAQEREKGSPMPDFRSLLYWAPDVTTGESGKQNLSFYTSDLPGEYVMVFQGITKEGKIAYHSKKFRVEGSL